MKKTKHRDKPGEQGKKSPGRPLGSKTSVSAAPAGLDEAEIMTIPQVAEYLNCHYSTVLRILKARKLPGFRLGGDWRFRRSDLERWISGQRAKPGDRVRAEHKGKGRPPKVRKNG
jgi:excisionase family DNA binding protein